MSYSNLIDTLRKNRENEINAIKKKYKESNEQFHYFPIDEKWKLPANIYIRSPKDGVKDYETVYQKIGKVEIKFHDNQFSFNLYSLENQGQYFICLRDLTSTEFKTSYSVGRFVPIFKDNNSFFIDFNLAFAPVCGHLIKVVPCPMIRDEINIKIEAGEKYLGYKS